MEEFQSMSAKPLKKCPECGKNKLKRLIGIGAGVIFKDLPPSPKRLPLTAANPKVKATVNPKRKLPKSLRVNPKQTRRPSKYDQRHVVSQLLML
jgi:putative FmdB family regulatory protein